jgi:hypothetical protein
MRACCVLIPCDLVNGYQSFEEPALKWRKNGAYSSKRRQNMETTRRHIPDDRNLNTTVRTSNLTSRRCLFSPDNIKNVCMLRRRKYSQRIVSSVQCNWHMVHDWFCQPVFVWGGVELNLTWGKTTETVYRFLFRNPLSSLARFSFV